MQLYFRLLTSHRPGSTQKADSPLQQFSPKIYRSSQCNIQHSQTHQVQNSILSQIPTLPPHAVVYEHA